MVRECFDVLHDCRQMELVAWLDELRRVHEHAGLVTSALVHVAGHFALGRILATLRFQRGKRPACHGTQSSRLLKIASIHPRFEEFFSSLLNMIALAASVTGVIWRAG